MKVTFEIMGPNLKKKEVKKLREVLVKDAQLMLDSNCNGHIKEVTTVKVKLEPGPFIGYSTTLSKES